MKRFQSIRWRLQIWYGLLLATVLGGFGVAVYRVESEGQFRRNGEEMQRRVQVLAASRHPMPNAHPPRQQFVLQPENTALFDQEDGAGFYYVAWLHGGDPPIYSKSAPRDVPMPEEMASSGQRIRAEFQEVFFTPAHGDCLLVGHSLARDLGDLHRLAAWLVIAGSAVLVLGLIGGAWLVHRALQPIWDISQAAQKVATGDLSQRIATSASGSELGQLVNVLNSTFARLDTAFTQQARFTADAAHELRTPVSVMLAQSQDGLGSACENDEHRQAFEASQRAANRMRRLIDSLLELARLDAGQEPPRRHPCDLAAIAAEGLELIRASAAQRGIQIHAQLAPAVCPGDCDRLAQVVTNLLTNAIEYNHEGGEIYVATRCKNELVELVVHNSGLGIARGDLPHIFDRFYRADKARSGQAGHTGLGLAIVKSIVQSHGGSIEAMSDPGKGAIFTVTLPS